MSDIRFGFQAAAADVAGLSDQQLYSDLMSDCALGHRLGYDAAWLSRATPGTPLAVRQKMMTRFAEEICPRYSGAMRQGKGKGKGKAA